MNLFSLSSPLIAAINPFKSVTIWRYCGYQKNDDLTLSPEYQQIKTSGDIQAISSTELQQLEKMNIQGTEFAMYLKNFAYPMNRANQYGGDFIEYNGKQWLILSLLEAWGQDGEAGAWCKVAVKEKAND